ncbi:MAG: acyl carrier protein, partial [Patescibacteria group bacterium]
ETQKKIGNEDVDLIAGGVLDSFTMIKLIDFIEKELGVKLDMERLTTENFNSINTIITGIKELGNRN